MAHTQVGCERRLEFGQLLTQDEPAALEHRALAAIDFAAVARIHPRQVTERYDRVAHLDLTRANLDSRDATLKTAEAS